MSTKEPDEFDRIVEGITFDSIDESIFDEQAEEHAAQIESAESDIPPPSEDLPEFAEVTYREALPVSASGDIWRTRGWLTLVALPMILIASAVLNIHIPKTLIGIVTVGAVGLLGYLLLTNPETESGTFWSDDGTAL